MTAMQPMGATVYHGRQFPGYDVCRALPVYIPVYLVPALLVHRKALMDPKKAPDIARRVAMGAARSSLFLALYCTLCWRGACIGFQSTGMLLCSWKASLVLFHVSRKL